MPAGEGRENRMLQEMKIGFIGAGQMSEAIFSGALAAGGLLPQNITVCDILASRLAQMAEQYGVNTLQTGAEGDGAHGVIAQSDVVVLAIKPQVARTFLAALSGAAEAKTTVISIVGGFTLEALESSFPESPVLRVMPNTPMMVGRGCAGIVPGCRAGEKEIALCCQLFDLVGESVLLDEGLINAFTAVGGCGPAFAYQFIEALADGAVKQGLPRALAVQTAARMLAGASEMVLATGQHPGQLKDSVCSPGGGTIAGVHALEAGGFRAAVMDAVEQSCQRMDELGK